MLIKTFCNFTLKFKQIFHERDFPLFLWEFPPWNMIESGWCNNLKMRAISSQIHHLTKMKCYDRLFPNEFSISAGRTGLFGALIGFILEGMYVRNPAFIFSGL